MFSVGISDFTCPVRIPEKGGSLQDTVARIALKADNPVEDGRDAADILRDCLLARLPDLHSGVFPALLAEARERTGAAEARVTMRFPYFIRKTAPVSFTPSLMEYRCAFGASTADMSSDEPELAVAVPVTTLCPCSREISDMGAHNQRALVTLSVRPKALVWLEDLIAMAESCGSCGVYALLKRPDEKYVTEWAYEHPMFVEDVARKVAQRAAAHPDIARFAVSVESFESIHSHNAFALVDSESMAVFESMADFGEKRTTNDAGRLTA